jgi:hypothetical protein
VHPGEGGVDGMTLSIWWQGLGRLGSGHRGPEIKGSAAWCSRAQDAGAGGRGAQGPGPSPGIGVEGVGAVRLQGESVLPGAGAQGPGRAGNWILR